MPIYIFHINSTSLTYILHEVNKAKSNYINGEYKINYLKIWIYLQYNKQFFNFIISIFKAFFVKRI